MEESATCIYEWVIGRDVVPFRMHAKISLSCDGLIFALFYLLQLFLMFCGFIQVAEPGFYHF